MKNIFRAVHLLLTALLLIIISGCASDNFTLREIYSDGEYDTQFPSNEASNLIEEISKSVKLINSLVFYKQYHYRWNDRITGNDMKDNYILRRAVKVSNQNKTASGTGVIVGETQNKLLFLTNAHIVDFPDTVITYFSNDSGKVSRYIESISVKQSQSNYVSLSGVGNLEIVHLDVKTDVALAGCDIQKGFPRNFSVFNYKIGNSRELKWGDFVYVLGYPMHYKMLTTGIVSIVENEDEYFMVDVNVNRGSSGSIVLALRDGIPNFELVGIVSLVPAERKNVLIPKSLNNDGRYQLEAKYEGDIIVGEIENVRYGIAKVISVEAIKNSLENKVESIRKKGYSLEAFNELLDINR